MSVAVTVPLAVAVYHGDHRTSASETQPEALACCIMSACVLVTRSVCPLGLFAWCALQRSGIHHFLGSGVYASKYYCGRVIGRERLPGSDGQCGPTNGPQCEECKAHQAAQVVAR